MTRSARDASPGTEQDLAVQAALDRLVHYARNTGVSPELVGAIFDKVAADMPVSDWQEQLAEVRRRVMTTALGPAPEPLAGPVTKLP